MIIPIIPPIGNGKSFWIVLMVVKNFVVVVNNTVVCLVVEGGEVTEIVRIVGTYKWN